MERMIKYLLPYKPINLHHLAAAILYKFNYQVDATTRIRFLATLETLPFIPPSSEDYWQPV